VDEALTSYIHQAIIALRHPLKVFCLNGSKEYGKRVAEQLSISLSPHVEKSFEDGECYVKSADGDVGNVRGHNVFVIQSLYSGPKESVADKLLKLAIFCGSLRSASAHSITAIIPHLAFARQDRKTESRAPITTKIIASMLESVGIDRAIFMDVHNLSAVQNAFSLRFNADHLEAKLLHADWCAARLENAKKIVVLSPDSGGVGRSERFRNALGKKLLKDISLASYDKRRRVDGSLVGDNIIGDVDDAEVLLYDDMISTAGTITKAGLAVPRFGGRLFAVLATHGLFCGEANRYVEQLDTKIVVADTVEPWRLTAENRKKIEIIDTSKLVSQAIWRNQTGTGSISELLR
jgi:ribose-phosphate pyrophosphokinase